MTDEPRAHPDPDRFRVHAEIITLMVEGAVYAVAMSPTVAVLGYGLGLPFPILLLAFVASGVVDIVLFALALVGLRRLLARRIPVGRYLMSNPMVLPWLVAERIARMMVRSPFWRAVNDYHLLSRLYYKGMGASFGDGVVFASGARIPEPWALRMGDRVVIGEEAILSGHKIEHATLTIGTIEIGDNVLVGARSIIFPDVTIGDGAMVAANSVVVRGTNIPPGETWQGNPARPAGLWIGRAERT